MAMNPSISALFKLFAVAFRPPQAGAWTNSISSGSLANDIASCWQALELPKEPLDAFLESTKPYIGRDPESLLHELRVEETRLFIGDGPLVENTEGTWLQARAGIAKPIRMINNHTASVTEFMKSCGVVRQPKYNDCIDYVENECDFAGYLASEPEALAELGLDAADKLDEFASEHMKRWLPGFCDDVRSATDVAYYRGICTLLKAFLEEF